LGQTNQQRKAMFAKGTRVSLDGKKGTIVGESLGHPTVQFDSGVTRAVFVEGLRKIKESKS